MIVDLSRRSQQYMTDAMDVGGMTYRRLKWFTNPTMLAL